jgi:GGDEF domain-containing protein
VGFALLTLVALSQPIGLVAIRAVNEASTPGDSPREAPRSSAHRRARSPDRRGQPSAFEDAIARCHDELTQMQHPFVLAFVDVDRFKRLNDSQGHVVGDRALRRNRADARRCRAPVDVIARLGGDEFAVLMPNADGRAMHRPFDAMSAP